MKNVNLKKNEMKIRNVALATNWNKVSFISDYYNFF